MDREVLLSLFRTMLKIRHFEKRVERLFLDGEIPGFVHLYIGEEAIAAGVCANLRKDDYITSTHRGHGHTIAKGADLKPMMAELFGKATGYCHGKGGSMHIADFSIGMLGANGVVGGGIPLAVGAALASKVKGSKQVAVAFFSDGATNRGTFHEGLNMASIWKLPVVFVCENNQWASTASSKEMLSVEDVAQRASAYAIPGITADGNDVLEVHRLSREAIERARNGDGPTLLEFKTFRIKGHFVGDPELYRRKEEVEEWMKKEPIERFKKYLYENGYLAKEDEQLIENSILNEIEEAVEFARSSPFPVPEDALTDLFVDDRGYDYY